MWEGIHEWYYTKIHMAGVIINAREKTMLSHP